MFMNYDEHEETSDPGPIASQTWFLNNLKRVLKDVPKEKIICAVGNYGYRLEDVDSRPEGPETSQAEGAGYGGPERAGGLAEASDADADLDLDYNSLNPHYSFIDVDKHVRHVVWFLDGVTVLDEMRGARALGMQTFALWSLGQEDRSLWSIWDKPSSPDALKALGVGTAGPRSR